MQMNELDYELPPAAIATRPAEPRDQSRLMVVRRAKLKSGDKGTVEHRRFGDLGDYLNAGDLLVVNDTRVVPAKLLLQRRSGAAISGLFLHEIETGQWEVMLRTRGRVKAGEALLAGRYSLALEEQLSEGRWRVGVSPAVVAAVVLKEIGHVPLPPYIERARKHSGGAGERPEDKEWYQTVYAQRDVHGGSVAAPTAGLHFTPALLAVLEGRGIRRAAVELEVGMGTFLPVETETLEAHRMHTERYAVPAGAVAAIRDCRKHRGRVVAVGTTAVRTLETAAGRILDPALDSKAIAGKTALKIAPGFAFQLTDVLITNFHLPRSTLMALVAAFLAENGVAHLKSLYANAIREGYRFYSYGDAMLIVP